MLVFFDTSAFIKRYIRETGTEEVLAWCDRATEIGLSGVALPEMISALCRLQREGRISDSQYRLVKSNLLADIEDAAVCDLTPQVLAHSITCLENNILRGMDAIHIGSALSLKADLFVSADLRQLEAASRAGLRIHPLGEIPPASL
jgi:predicted nucleic acid-binding protein